MISYINKNNLTLEGINKLKQCLLRLKKTLDTLGIHIIDAFATASLRNLDNKDEVLAIISNTVKINIVLLSGTTEGNLSFKGAMHQIERLKDYTLTVVVQVLNLFSTNTITI